MNWDDLRLFIAVAREPKLNLAANKLNLDSTTLSRRLRRLETDVGLTLFERSRKGHQLTSYGEKFLREAETVETAAIRAGKLGLIDQHEISGRIRLGVTEGLGATLVGPALGDFKSLHPLISIDLISLSGFVSVPKRQADMSILLSRPSTGRLKVQKISDYELGLFSSNIYKARNGSPRNLNEVKNHSLIGYVEDQIYSSNLRYLSELNDGAQASVSSTSILAQMAMTVSGAGICVLPKFMASTEKRLVPVLDDSWSISRSFWLVTHEDVVDLARIRAFSTFLLKSLKEKL